MDKWMHSDGHMVEGWQLEQCRDTTGVSQKIRRDVTGTWMHRVVLDRV